MWLFITIIAYFLFALVSITDKYLLRESVPNPKIFSFWAGMISIFMLVFLPFGLRVPQHLQMILDFLTGAILIFSLFFLYSALKNGEVSRVVTIVGALTPVFIFIFANFIFDKKSIPDFWQIFAVLFLIFGSVLISAEKFYFRGFSFRIFTLSLVSALLFALYYNLSKIAFSSQPFWSALIWIKLGGFFSSFLFLLSREVRNSVFQKGAGIAGKKTGAIFISKQAVGGVAGILENYAVFLAKFGEIVFINALQGVQYAFIFLFAFILTKKFPMIIREDFTRKVIMKKIIAISFIGVGIFLLSYHGF